jgi:hypothetical protein
LPRDQGKARPDGGADKRGQSGHENAVGSRQATQTDAWAKPARPDGGADKRRLGLLRRARGGKVRSLSNGTSRSLSAPQRVALGILGAVAWAGLALLGLAVKLALVPRRRSPGLSAVIWGIAFALYLWWGSHQVGLRETKAIALGVVAGVATALFVYLRGASLERPPADQAGVFLGRIAAKRRSSDH